MLGRAQVRTEVEPEVLQNGFRVNVFFWSGEF